MEDDFLDLDLSSRETLASRIIAAFRASTFDTRSPDFLPEDKLQELVRPDTVRDELDFDELERRFPQFDKQWQDDFIHWVLTEARSAFAIIIQCDRKPMEALQTMIKFRKLQFDDKSLPIDNPRTSGSVPKQFDTKIWNNARLYNFYEKQWKCLAPVFSPAQYDYNLSSECIFPFILAGAIPKEGAFSSVYRVEIHLAHQKHKNLSDVAIKEIKVNRGEDKTGTDTAWEYEARALEAINKLDHDHIVKCIAAIRRGDNRYFMFPWADGDSLRDFWEKAPRQGPRADIIAQAVIQLRGLADALVKLHHFSGGDPEHHGLGQSRELRPPSAGSPDVNIQNEVGDYADAANKESIRHGDLKPENILRFMDGNTGNMGVLKIADMGLAKRHVVATQDRSHLTSTRYGTIRYEAPETMTALHGRSRLYDIWSMGCITLEFIIWILYGNDELNNFYNQVKGDAQKQVCQYFEISENEIPRRAEVHGVVRRWMKHIQGTDPEFSQESALNDLLDVVRSKLLVVPLPPDRKSSVTRGRGLAPPAIGETVTTYRATASEFRDALDRILVKLRRPGYILTGKNRVGVKLPAPKTPDLLSPTTAGPTGRADGSLLSTGLPGRQDASGVISKSIRVDYTLPPLKDWEFPVDNTFADKVLAKAGAEGLRPRSTDPAKLCSRCKALNFWAGGFAFEDRVADFRERAKICDFCLVLLNICESAGGAPKGPKVRFERNQSSIVMAGGEPLPVLSIFRSPECRTPLPIQLGFPELPRPGTRTFFQIVKLWLEDCDDHARHRDCHDLPDASLPTRLIDVGTEGKPALRLLETREESIQEKQYIALSHPWGDPKQHEPYSTLRRDENGRTLENFKRSIPYHQLPATFKDAVDTTRALDVRYLWIDSICIIQGKDGDFNEESKRMEDVFSGAYCVLAASRAHGQHDGFLGPRSHRDFLTFQRGNEKPFYICQPIDNFSQDVLEGSLNKRGWVLQERALARRTVYFTDNQTYFECGNGVRCETLTRMHNNMADFLGDPKFPDKAMRTPSRALKISYFQDLYQQYSRLVFSRIEDRPFAIAGLEKRLQKAFDTKGGYGIFDDGPDGGLFHRSLLWQRGEDESSMTPIDFPAERNIKVPTWSWMAYKGGIDYGDPPFQTAEWEKEEIRPPWTRGGKHGVETTDQDAKMGLAAMVRDFTVAGRRADEVKLVYDSERTASDGQRPQCVVVARSKEGKMEREKRFYVLLVMPTGSVAGRGEKAYRRVGAGFMMGKYITLDGPGIAARIH